MKKTAATVGVAALLLFAGCGSILGEQGTAAPTQSDVATDEPTATVDRGTSTGSTPTETSAPTSTGTSGPSPTAAPDQTANPDPTTPDPTATDDADSTPTGETDSAATSEPPDVTVRGGNLSVDEDEVYAEVQELLGTDVDPPTVHVRDEMPALERMNGALASNPFYQMYGYGDEFINTSVYHGTASRERIVVMPKNASDAQVRTLLAHEYVHWMQFHSDAIDIGGFGSFVDDADSQQVVYGLVEGASVYVTDAYVDEYMDVSWNQTQELGEQYERGPAGRRLFRARYLFGARYIDSQVDRPRNVSWLYDESTPTPVTGEQMIHGLTPDEEPERDLTLSLNRTGNWTTARDRHDTRGEIVVRTMLRVELNRSTASAAAAGWGSDEDVLLEHAENDSRAAHAWALRWDDAGEADEFASAFESWRGERPSDDSTAYRLVRVDSETVAVFAGDPAFVGNATASGTNERVTVSASG